MDEAKFANDFEERHGWSPDIGYEVIEQTDNVYCELLRELRKAKPIGGKSTIITASGTYEIDDNYNPPRVVKKDAK